jgi:hypothetical protein
MHVRSCFCFKIPSCSFMTVHGESLEKIFAVFKSNSLVAAMSPYNWFQTDKFFDIINCKSSQLKIVLMALLQRPPEV